MREYTTAGRKVFCVFNYALVGLISLLCIVPLFSIVAKSLSGSAYLNAGLVFLWPRGFNFSAYRYVLENKPFWNSFGVTLWRLVLGIPINLILCILMAYPMSKESAVFPARKFFMGAFLMVMIFHGGLVPTYLLVKNLKMIDTIWALVLPGGLSVFNGVLMMNFFRGVPKEIEESALIDGASQVQILLWMYLPLAVPCIATITLFSFMGHWNAWQDGRIYMNTGAMYPLQTYLQTVLQMSEQMLKNLDPSQMSQYTELASQNLRAAQIVISTIPVLLVYPFMQRYFTTGLVLGSVKG
jgi:putative aldouronate transport system permease protein